MKEEMINKIIAYENGDLDNQEIIELFQELLNEGLVWELQGHYGRTAEQMIEEGVIKDENTRH